MVQAVIPGTARQWAMVPLVAEGSTVEQLAQLCQFLHTPATAQRVPGVNGQEQRQGQAPTPCRRQQQYEQLCMGKKAHTLSDLHR